MSCGTPIIAFRGGSVAEIIDDGVTGFIVESVEEAVEAWKKIESLDRKKVHQRFLERFTARTMGERYVEVYELGISEKTRAARGKRGLSLAI